MEKEDTEKQEETARPVPDQAIDTLRAENERLKEDIRMRTAAYEVAVELRRAGARSPELLVEAAKGELQFGEDGALSNLSAIVDHLRRRFPEQFGRDAATGTIDGGAGQNPPPTLTKDALAKMTPAEIQRLDWAEVRGVLSSQ